MEYYSYPLMIKSNHSSKPVSFIPITIMDTFPNHTITSISQTFSIESSDLLSYDLEDCQSINISSHPEK